MFSESKLMGSWHEGESSFALRDAIAQVRAAAAGFGEFDEPAAPWLKVLHDRIHSVYVDLEEEPILGYTLGRQADVLPSRQQPALVSINIGASCQQQQLAYAYLAAWTLVDARGCSVPLPPMTRAELLDLPIRELVAWRRALSLLLPRGLPMRRVSAASVAEKFALPEPLLVLYTQVS